MNSRPAASALRFTSIRSTRLILSRKTSIAVSEKALSFFEKRAQHYDVGSLRGTKFVSDCRCRNTNDSGLRKHKVRWQTFIVVEDQSAGSSLRSKFAQRYFVHCNQNVGMRNDGRADSFF